jgi:hypothetical protein
MERFRSRHARSRVADGWPANRRSQAAALTGSLVRFGRVLVHADAGGYKPLNWNY